MAIINNSKNFVFVHVPKAAGTSVTNALSKYTTYLDLEIGGTHFGEIIQPAYKKRFGLGKHSPASGMRTVIGEDKWNEMFTFSIVRNPYERVISTFKFLNKWEGTPAKYKEELSKFKDINEYILSNMWEESDGPDFIFKPQTFWLTDVKDRNKVIVDFIGKLETLDIDLAKIKSKIEGCEIEEKPTAQLNKTEGEYNLSVESIAKINSHYSRDFAFFDYKTI
ncbi:sulfotransferase family protein [Vibrio wakamikoensis]|uniref:sulfotransferase family 2 domain-containing protein n=1 Tax=Vibrio wakamikoensis TaxID=2910251 RepID=UPI003D220BAC